MSDRQVTNVPASIRARLRNAAKEQDVEFNQILIYYAIERFLYRLSQTEWSDRLIIKGAIMLRAWGTPLGRPTRDIDFLGRFDSSPEAVIAAVQECLGVEYVADGLVFDPEIKTGSINAANRYPGIRVVVTGHLSGARFKLQLDIGIDNAVVPDPEWVDYPTLLDLEAPRILVYMPPTAVAEKFEAMVSRGAANSRMKDFYDVWLLARTNEFDGRELSAALLATFTHRETDLSSEPPLALTAGFFADAAVQGQWSAFLAKSEIEAPESLGEVCIAIEEFIMPAVAAAAEGQDLESTWSLDDGWS